MKKNKTVSIIILLVVVLIAGYFLMNRNNSSNQIVEQEIPLEMTEILGSDNYDINLVESKIEWTGKKSFVNNWVDVGSINAKDGNISIKDNIIESLKINIDMNSISANKTGSNGGFDKLTGHLKSADFFDVENYPTSNFILTNIEKTGEANRFNVAGNLTIKDITNPISFPALVYMNNDNLHFDANFGFDRSKFDVKFGSKNFFSELGDKTIDDIVELKINIVANK